MDPAKLDKKVPRGKHSPPLILRKTWIECGLPSVDVASNAMYDKGIDCLTRSWG